ncbi:MAG: hypothetical protein WAW17_05540 [Rhodococcus sp. (in: high G+C Gram-positive bacteria)]|uniref:hypothetical protein n=1 Tax=Rhodococcus sp. TaxID=1831 RepID=UPI003BAF9C64
MADNRYERITWRGRTHDRYTVAALKAAEYDLDRTLTIYQGINPGGVAASGTTHDGPAVDCWCPGITGRELARALRRVGFAAWYRPELWRDGRRVWGPHVHAIPLGNPNISPAAARQVTEYLAGGDGLVGDYVDPDPWRPSPVAPFTYHEDPDMDLLADLVALRKEYRVSLVKVARVALRGAAEHASGTRLFFINTARRALRRIK